MIDSAFDRKANCVERDVVHAVEWSVRVKAFPAISGGIPFEYELLVRSASVIWEVTQSLGWCPHPLQ